MPWQINVLRKSSPDTLIKLARFGKLPSSWKSRLSHMTTITRHPGPLNIEAISIRFGDRISEIIDRHVVVQETPVEEARNQFSAMLERALDGQCQVIGKRRRALLISVDEIATMLQEASMPLTWGEAFDPTEELPGIAETLRISEDRAPRPEFIPRERQVRFLEDAQPIGA
jgi:hypothetical protein